MIVTAKDLKAIAPGAKASLLEPLARAMNLHLPSAEIDTPNRILHFLSQAAHETAGFKTLHEYWGPTAAQVKYEGRKDLGNTEPGDGKRYMGRGIFQLTGRANYRAIGKRLGLPLEAHPEMAAQPETSVLIACEYWKSRGINDVANEATPAAIKAVSIKINGKNKKTGLPNGLEDRKAYFKRAQKVMKFEEVEEEEKPILTWGTGGSDTSAPPATAPVESEVSDVVLTPMSGKELISTLQKLLVQKNYGKLNPDGQWGQLTSMSVTALQTANDLPLDPLSIKWSDAQAAKVFVVESREDMTIADVRKTETETATELNKTTLVKTGGAVITAGAAGEQTGFFDWIGSATEKIGVLQPAVEAFSKVWEFASNNLGWVFAGVGVAVFFIARNTEFKIFKAFKRGD